MRDIPFPTWQTLLDAPRSALFPGPPCRRALGSATLGERAPHGEALFTQSNARVLLGQAAACP